MNPITFIVFVYKNKEKYPIYVSKQCCIEKYVLLLLIGKEQKTHYILIKDFNTYIYDHILNHRRKHFCGYCLEAFSTEKNTKTSYERLL